MAIIGNMPYFQTNPCGGIWRMIGDPLKLVYWDFPALPWRHGWMKEVPVSRGWTAACLDRTMTAAPAGGVYDHTANVGLGFVLKMTLNARSQFPQILTMIFHHCPSLFLFIIFHQSHHLTRIVNGGTRDRDWPVKIMTGQLQAFRYQAHTWPFGTKSEP